MTSKNNYKNEVGLNERIVVHMDIYTRSKFYYIYIYIINVCKQQNYKMIKEICHELKIEKKTKFNKKNLKMRSYHTKF